MKQERSAKGGFSFLPRPLKTAEVDIMFKPKGYSTSQGYTGFLPNGRRMAFPTQDEYLEFLSELEEESA